MYKSLKYYRFCSEYPHSFLNCSCIYNVLSIFYQSEPFKIIKSIDKANEKLNSTNNNII